MPTLQEIIGLIFLVGGTLFVLIGVYGTLFRLKDVYQRLHAAGTVGTLGLVLILIGVTIMQPDIWPRTLVLTLFVVITAPVATHAIANAAHGEDVVESGMKRDDLRDDFPSEQRK
jgi:multicomponent Na+:H+ antiporter subunit G